MSDEDIDIEELKNKKQEFEGKVSNVQDNIKNVLSLLENSLVETENNLEEVEKEYEAVLKEIEDLEEQVEEKKTQVSENISNMFDDVEKEELEKFMDKPYTLLPKEENEAWLIVPRWVPFNLGFLHSQDETYNKFVINKYADWIMDIPDPIFDKVGLDKEYDSVEYDLDSKQLEFSSEEERDEAWDNLGGRDGGLYKRDGENKIKVKKDSEFQVISDIIESGNLPFKPQPVDHEDIRNDVKSEINLWDQQERAWEEFKKNGMIGVYWPMGYGKTFFSLYAGDKIKGKKLVIVPSSLLETQWKERINERCQNPEEWEVRTYNYLTTGNNRKDYKNIKLTVYDEGHTLPADTFSKLSTLDTKYRIGLSATPYREDDRGDYVFALTGKPIGLNWEEYLDTTQELPDVEVRLHDTYTNKKKDVKNILEESVGKTIIFCDRIQKGKALSKYIDVPFVHGETNNKMNKIRNNQVVICSRVADEGMSLEDIDQIIEYNFHGSSRRQELQRAGRMMHGDSNGDEKHIVMMTNKEYDKFKDRLLSLEEKGFNIRYVRASS